MGTPAAAAPSTGAKKVVVIGAGLAGLAAAYEILKAKPSTQVLILEAQNRIGGRVHTVRSDQETGAPFDDGQYAEIGAQRIPDSHDRTLGYIKEFGLSKKLIAFGDLRQKYVIGANTFYSDSPLPPGLGLSPYEESVSLYASSYEYEFKYATGRTPPRGFNGIGSVAVPKNGTSKFPEDSVLPQVGQWEGLSLPEFQRSHGASDGWLRLYQARNGTDASTFGAVPWLVGDAIDWSWNQTLYLNGGLDQLPAAFYAKLNAWGVPVMLGSAVTSVKRLANGQVELSVRAGGSTSSMVADEVVCTVPFPVLAARVDLSQAGLSTSQLDSIAHRRMSAASRIVLQQKSRFVWQGDSPTNPVEGLFLAYTDRPIERLMHSTNTQPGVSGILQAYLQEDNARSAPTTGTLAWANDQVAREVFPFAASAEYGWNGKGWAKHWHLDPWAGGGWSVPRANEFASEFWWWRTPGGPVHFAGEGTSLYLGWMQGALESGQRVARDVLARL